MKFFKVFVFLSLFISFNSFAYNTKQTSYEQTNKVNDSRRLRIQKEASKVDFTNVKAEFRGSLCGPATLFPVLNSIGKLEKNSSFSSFVNSIHEDGNFSYFNIGMTARQLQNALYLYDIKSQQVKYYDVQSHAEDIVDALDAGKFVFLIVKAEVAYEKITQHTYPGEGGYHWVQPVAAQKDENGKTISIAIYDINSLMYNKAVRRPLIEYISYEKFIAMMQPTIYEGFYGSYGVYVTTDKSFDK